LGYKILTVVASFIILFSAAIFVISYSGENATADSGNGYIYSTVNGGTEAMITGYQGTGGAITFPSILGGHPVTSVGSYAFQGNSNVTTITFNSNMKSIRYNAFDGCSALTSITLPSGLTTIESAAFIGTSLTNVVIPDSVTSVGSSAFKISTLQSIKFGNNVTTINGLDFQSCTHLSNIVFGTGLKSIRYNAFDGCSALTSITLPSGLTTIESAAFIGTGITSIDINCNLTSVGSSAFNPAKLKTVIIEDGVKIVPYGAFLGYTSLTSVTIGNDVTAIGGKAFYGCTNIATMNIPDGVINIEGEAFSGCTYLMTFKAGLGLQIIGNGAFYGCSNLVSGDIPIGVTTIGSSAFESCVSITSFTIPNTVTVVGSRAFYGCTNLAKMNVPDSVISIGSGAFSGCVKLNSVTTGTGLETIGESAFYGCINLGSITLHENLTTIGAYAFKSCTSLNYVDLPDKLTTISEEAFSSCTKLESITIPDSVTTNGGSIFFNCINLASVTIGNGVTTTGYRTFFQCTALSSVNIGQNVVIIDIESFYKCQSLMAVTIPSKVSIIKERAFGYCSMLSTVTFDGNAPSLGYSCLGDCSSSLTLYYNPTCIGYSTPNWQDIPCYPSTTPRGVPGAPSHLLGTIGDCQVILSWNTPNSNGGSPIDYFIVYQNGTALSTHISNTSTSTTITGLINGVTYAYEIAAHNSYGTGPRSEPVNATSNLLAIAINSPSYGSHVNNSMVIVWWSINSTAGLKKVETSKDGANWTTTMESQLNLTGLIDGSITIHIRATDMVGNVREDAVLFVVDTALPSVKTSSPVGSNVHPTTNIYVSFNEEMNKALTIIEVNGIDGNLTWNGDTLSYRPSRFLTGNTEYTIIVNGVDIAGNHLATFTWRFVTAAEGWISGAVKDEGGNWIPDALVDLVDSLTGEKKGSTSSNNFGSYMFYDMPVGVYTISITKGGYNISTRTIELTTHNISAGGASVGDVTLGKEFHGIDDYTAVLLALCLVLALIDFFLLERLKDYYIEVRNKIKGVNEIGEENEARKKWLKLGIPTIAITTVLVSLLYYIFIIGQTDIMDIVRNYVVGIFVMLPVTISGVLFQVYRIKKKGKASQKP
jgi:hypothetical protein